VAILLLRLSAPSKIGGHMQLLNHQCIYELNSEEMIKGFQSLAGFLVQKESIVNIYNNRLPRDVRLPGAMMLPPEVALQEDRPFDVVSAGTATLVLRLHLQNHNHDSLEAFVDNLSLAQGQSSKGAGDSQESTQ
jgi:hypothetical protein